MIGAIFFFSVEIFHQSLQLIFKLLGFINVPQSYNSDTTSA